ncbi:MULTISPECIES: UbiA-like protein EboC [unclassified Allomuricauda]|uniref:UbiA-like protein EboC n=1 Tax=unclassified Allomuricauda TaxID=2615049 RepID=UPI00273EB9C4|nr:MULTISPECIES: UbiA-like protein EboC [unclassified Allomuricauda]
MSPRLKAYLQLCRPANLPTAAADVLAGTAISGLFAVDGAFQLADIAVLPFLLLVMAPVFLYAGGVVLNDVFDIEIDRVERPERPIPSGVVPLGKARSLGFVLLAVGIGLAFFVGKTTGLIAVFLALSILSYDKFAKHHPILGPLNMGVCRGLNLLMGISLLGTFQYWPYVLLPIVFIFAVTMISRGEVHGKNKGNIRWAGILYGLVIAGVVYLHYTYAKSDFWYVLFLVLFGLMVFRPLIIAYRDNTPNHIKNAVKSGVLSIVLLDASLAVAHSNLLLGILTLLLLPLSIFLAKQFAVT